MKRSQKKFSKFIVIAAQFFYWDIGNRFGNKKYSQGFLYSFSGTAETSVFSLRGTQKQILQRLERSEKSGYLNCY